MTDLISARASFSAAIATAKDADAAYGALLALTRAVAPARLFTVTLTDMAAGVARRAYTSDAEAYPVSGTKPLADDGWSEIIHKQRRTYVENDIASDLEHFTDYDLIVSLGCEAVVNLPIIIGDELAGTVNILDAKGVYTTDVVAQIEAELRVPAMLAILIAAR